MEATHIIKPEGLTGVAERISSPTLEDSMAWRNGMPLYWVYGELNGMSVTGPCGDSNKESIEGWNNFWSKARGAYDYE